MENHIKSLETQWQCDGSAHFEVNVGYNAANKGHNTGNKATYQADTKRDNGADMNTDNEWVIGQ